MTSVDVAIIGAGAAGIGAARALHGSGLDLLLIEATQRVGGRARTDHVAGMPIDLGCGWLHSADRNPWVDIAATLGMAVDRTPTAWDEQYRDLGFPPADQAAAAAAYATFDRTLRRGPPASDCAADALPPGGRWNAHLDALSSYINGVGLASLSVADYLAYDDAASDVNWRVSAGYGTLVARAMPPVPLVMGCPVWAIRDDGAALALDTPAGTVHARVAIVTVSTRVLADGRLRLPAALDDHAHAAAALPLGLADKLFLHVADAGVLDPDSHLIGAPQEAETGSYYLRPFGRPVVECFLGGATAAALEGSGIDGAVAFAREELGALLGNSFARGLVPIAGSGWGNEDWIGGSYSHALPGRRDARATLAQPWNDRIFFAGEACSATDFSTAHGALDSGIAAARQARRVLAGATSGC